MVYGLVTEKVKHHQSKLQKLVSFRDFKNLNVENLKDNLRTAPWHVGEMFESVDVSYYHWTSLLNTIFKHMPVKRMKVRAKDVPYMTQLVRKLLEQSVVFRNGLAKLGHRRALN